MAVTMKVNKPQESNPDELSPRQDKAAMLLASGQASKAVAQDVGVSAETVSRWKKSLAFQAQVNTYRLEALESGKNLARSLLGQAFQVLADIMNDPATSAGDRVRAVSKIIDTVAPFTREARQDVGETDREACYTSEVNRRYLAGLSMPANPSSHWSYDKVSGDEVLETLQQYKAGRLTLTGVELLLGVTNLFHDEVEAVLSNPDRLSLFTKLVKGEISEATYSLSSLYYENRAVLEGYLAGEFSLTEAQDLIGVEDLTDDAVKGLLATPNKLIALTKTLWNQSEEE